MHDFASGNELTGTFAHLRRTDNAVTSRIRTTAAPGDAVTLWYVIFNQPGNCDGECGADDIFLVDAGGNPQEEPDGNPMLNHAQIEATRLSVVYGGEGAVVNPGGRLALNGGLAEDEVPSGTVPVAIGHPDDDPALAPGPVTGLEDALGAEIHVVLQTHGPAHTDPNLRHAQLTGFFTATPSASTSSRRPQVGGGRSRTRSGASASARSSGGLR